MADWAGHGWAAAEGSVPGWALSPVATPRLGSQQPLRAGQSCLDGPAAGHGWPLHWEVPSLGNHPSGSGPWAQDPLPELVPTWTQQATVPGWHSGSGNVSSTPPLCLWLWNQADKAVGLNAMPHLSLRLTLFICEMGITTAPPSKVVDQGEDDNACDKVPGTKSGVQ